MKLKVVLMLFLGIFLVASVSAVTTTLNLKTLPHHTVFVTPRSATDHTDPLISSMKVFSGQYGDVVLTFDIEESYFSLFVLVKEEDKVVFNSLLEGPFTSGVVVNATAAPEGFVFPKNPDEEVVVIEDPVEVVEKPEEVVEEIIEETGFFKKIILTGYSIIEEHKPVVSKVYYFLIGFVVLLLFFVTVKHKKQGVFPKKKSGEHIDEDFELEEEIRITKDKLKNLEEKKTKKIRDVRQKLIDDQKELMRLRGNKFPEEKEVSVREMKDKLREDF